MGLCINTQGSDSDQRDKTISSKHHTQNGKSLTSTHGEMAQQPKSIEGAIERNEQTKEKLENEISDLQQQLEGNR